jgi:hypothetical protein
MRRAGRVNALNAAEGVRVSKLVHEVWEEISDGMVLHTCCLCGPRGADCRHTLATGARLLTTFEAGSHFEAMTAYHRYLDREAYTTDQAWDHQPYPTEWQVEQQRHL